ncbi:hypothetical protein GCM10025776_35220 [Corallincola platygyrae]
MQQHKESDHLRHKLTDSQVAPVKQRDKYGSNKQHDAKGNDIPSVEDAGQDKHPNYGEIEVAKAYVLRCLSLQHSKEIGAEGRPRITSKSDQRKPSPTYRGKT